MIKALVKGSFRNLGLITFLDTCRFQVLRFKKREENNNFKKAHPKFPLPPDYILYESHLIDYSAYYNNGLNEAKNLIAQFSKFINLEGKRILDWGCGPSRVIRHFPDLLPKSEFYGTDYNKNSIVWSLKYIPNVKFETNGTNPPTNFESNYFDVIYGLSIFTHLSEDNHKKWIDELYRITARSGILYLTTHGEGYKSKLFGNDLKKFENNQLVTHGNTKEGHRTFTAYHPPKLMKLLFEEKFSILEQIPGKKESWGFSQDVWILRKEN